jgi:hypothetical protein
MYYSGHLQKTTPHEKRNADYQGWFTTVTNCFNWKVWSQEMCGYRWPSFFKNNLIGMVMSRHLIVNIMNYNTESSARIGS